MDFEWDEAKRQANFLKHGVDFAIVANFEWDTAQIREDTRHDYGERRWRALGLIEMRVLAVAFTHRGTKIRIISVRYANRKEVKSYA